MSLPFTGGCSLHSSVILVTHLGGRVLAVVVVVGAVVVVVGVVGAVGVVGRLSPIASSISAAYLKPAYTHKPTSASPPPKAGAKADTTGSTELITVLKMSAAERYQEELLLACSFNAFCNASHFNTNNLH